MKTFVTLAQLKKIERAFFTVINYRVSGHVVTLWDDSTSATLCIKDLENNPLTIEGAYLKSAGSLKPSDIIAQHLLGVQPVGNPQDVVNIEPLDLSDSTVEVVQINETFLEALKFSSAAQSKEESRYYLKGTYLAPNGDIVATDGHRLHMTQAASGSVCAAPQIVKIEAIATILDLAKSLKQTPEITLIKAERGSYIVANFTGAQIRSKAIEGSFPDYQRVVPAQVSSCLYVWHDIKTLKDECSRVCALAKISGAKYPRIRFNSLLQVSTDSAEGEHVTLNAHYLLDLLKAFEERDEKLVAFASVDTDSKYWNTSPVLFIGEKADYLSAVIMPIRDPSTKH